MGNSKRLLLLTFILLSYHISANDDAKVGDKNHDSYHDMLQDTDIDTDIDTDMAGTIQPNIIFVFADDWGYNEWSSMECSNGITTYLDGLVKDEGLLLPHNYVNKVCSPSRASFLSGRYPSRLGLQNEVFNANIAVSLTRQVSLLSEEFHKSGYSTHIIGKWHLGYQSWEYTPTYRGFDTFHGFYNGFNEYYSHEASLFDTNLDSTSEDTDTNNDGLTGVLRSFYDLRDNEDPDQAGVDDEEYGVWMERDQAVELIDIFAADVTMQPFFLYLPLQASHAPDQAPTDYKDLFSDFEYESDVQREKRMSSMAQTVTLDEALKDIVEHLKDTGLWDNTLLVFSSDNGGDYDRGDNYPLRGFKNTSFEGGIRVPGFVSGGFLSEERRGKSLDDVMVHVVDWYPTLLEAAGIEVSHVLSKRLYDSEGDDVRYTKRLNVPLDGFSIWEYIQNDHSIEEIASEVNIQSRELLLDLNDVYCDFSSCGALRVGNWKFLRGDGIGTLLPTYDDGDTWYDGFSSCTDLDSDLSLGCDNSFDEDSVGCQSEENGCLFNIETDPCEHTNLADSNPGIVAEMVAKLDDYQSKATTSLIRVEEEMAFDLYNPEIMCGSQFWCPYQAYDVVYFEDVISDDYVTMFDVEKMEQMKEMNEEKEKEKNGSFSMFEWSLVLCSIVLSVFFVYRFRFKNTYSETKQINERFIGVNDEHSPLI